MIIKKRDKIGLQKIYKTVFYNIFMKDLKKNIIRKMGIGLVSILVGCTSLPLSPKDESYLIQKQEINKNLVSIYRTGFPGFEKTICEIEMPNGYTIKSTDKNNDLLFEEAIIELKGRKVKGPYYRRGNFEGDDIIIGKLQREIDQYVKIIREENKKKKLEEWEEFVNKK